MWAGLSAALERRDAAALGRLIEAPIDVERAVRHPLTRAFAPFSTIPARGGSASVKGRSSASR